LKESENVLNLTRDSCDI